MLTRSKSSWTATLKKSKTGLLTQNGKPHCEIWIDASELDSIERWRSGVLRSGERRSQIGLSLRSTYQDLGIPMKIEIQSDSSTANPLTDRLGAGQRTKHIDTRYFWIQEPVQDGDLSVKKVPTAKSCPDVGTKPVSASVLQQHCKVAGLVFY